MARESTLEKPIMDQVERALRAQVTGHGALSFWSSDLVSPQFYRSTEEHPRTRSVNTAVPVLAQYTSIRTCQKASSIHLPRWLKYQTCFGAAVTDRGTQAAETGIVTGTDMLLAASTSP